MTKERNEEIYKITLITNRDGNQILQEKCNREINIDKCVIEKYKELKIVYLDGLSFTHEEVKSIESLGEYGLKVYTTKKVWYIDIISQKKESNHGE